SSSTFGSSSAQRTRGAPPARARVLNTSERESFMTRRSTLQSAGRAVNPNRRRERDALDPAGEDAGVPLGAPAPPSNPAPRSRHRVRVLGEEIDRADLG